MLISFVQQNYHLNLRVKHFARIAHFLWTLIDLWQSIWLFTVPILGSIERSPFRLTVHIEDSYDGFQKSGVRIALHGSEAPIGVAGSGSQTGCSS